VRRTNKVIPKYALLLYNTKFITDEKTPRYFALEKSAKINSNSAHAVQEDRWTIIPRIISTS
jgi:hypothetical protein